MQPTTTSFSPLTRSKGCTDALTLLLCGEPGGVVPPLRGRPLSERERIAFDAALEAVEMRCGERLLPPTRLIVTPGDLPFARVDGESSILSESLLRSPLLQPLLELSCEQLNPGEQAVSRHHNIHLLLYRVGGNRPSDVSHTRQPEAR